MKIRIGSIPVLLLVATTMANWPAKADQSWTDFSGYWRGECTNTSPSDRYPFEFELRQDSFKSITFVEGPHYPSARTFKLEETAPNLDPEKDIAPAEIYGWNRLKTTLIHKSVRTDSGHVSVSMGTFKLVRKNKMVISHEMVRVDPIEDTKFTFECYLTRTKKNGN